MTTDYRPILAALADQANAGVSALPSDMQVAAKDKIDGGVVALGNVVMAAIKLPDPTPTPAASLTLARVDATGKDMGSFIGLTDKDAIAGIFKCTVPCDKVSRTLDGQAITPDEGTAPYSLFGDTNGAKFTTRQLTPGSHVIAARAMKGGNVVAMLTMTFTVAASVPAPGPVPDPGPTNPPTLGVLGHVPEANEVAQFDRNGLKVITGNYKLQPGEVLKNAIVKKGEIIVAYKKGQVPGRIENVEVDAGYVSQSNKGNPYCINCNGNEVMIEIVNCDLHHSANAGVYGDNYTIRRSRLHSHAADGSKPELNAVTEECLIEDIGMDNPLSHADGGQTEGTHPASDPASTYNVVYRRNNIHLVAGTRNGHTFKATQGIMFSARANCVAKGLLVEGNRIYVSNGSAGKGIHAYTDSGNGSSITLKDNDVTAEIPIAAESNVKQSGNKETKLAKKN